MKSIIQSGASKLVIHKQFNDLFAARNSNWAASHTISATMAIESGLTIEYYDKELGIETLLSGKLVKV